jgi:hypothetical protein
MKRCLAVLILAAPMLDASAGYYFSVPSRRPAPFGVGRMEIIPRPDTFESIEAAREFCMLAATSALIRFGDGLQVSALSTLPESPIAPPILPKIFPAVLPLKASQTVYQFPQNR